MQELTVKSRDEIEMEIHRLAIEASITAGDGADIPIPAVMELTEPHPETGGYWMLSFNNTRGLNYVRAAARQVAMRWDVLPSPTG